MNIQQLEKTIAVFKKMLETCSDQLALASIQDQHDYYAKIYEKLLTPEQIAVRVARVEELRRTYAGTVQDNRRQYHQRRAVAAKEAAASFGKIIELVAPGQASIALQIAARRMAGGAV